MTARFKKTTLPERDEMLRRLMNVSPDSYWAVRFYPLLTKYAGQRLSSEDIVMMFTLAAAEYAEGISPAAMYQLYMLIPEFVRRIVDDDEDRLPNPLVTLAFACIIIISTGIAFQRQATIIVSVNIRTI